MHTGPYTFGKLTSDEPSSPVQNGTWFNDDLTEHKVSDSETRYARYRDGMVLQDKDTPRFFVYDQATAMIGPAATLPSDAVGYVTIRGGMIYVGGLAKVYSYEIATSEWRMQPIAGTGTCSRVAAGRTRLFAMCANPSGPNGSQQLFSMWANKTMSDVVPLGTLAMGSTVFTWISAAPNDDIAYFSSRDPDPGCIGKATTTTMDSCAIAMNTLGTLQSATVKSAQPLDDGTSLFVALYTATDSDTALFEVKLPSKQLKRLRTIDSYATCPDNSVVYQDFTISERYAGGVTTSVRLGYGGEYEMGCPLKKL